MVRGQAQADEPGSGRQVHRGGQSDLNFSGEEDALEDIGVKEPLNALKGSESI